MFRTPLAAALAFVGAMTGFDGQLLFAGQSGATAQPPDTAASAEPALSILVLTGQDGVNVIKRKTAVQPSIEVRDRNNRPVAGAVVNFTAPTMGASVLFANGRRTISMVTDLSGRAAVEGMQPVGAGPLKIIVTAGYDQHFVSTTISQTNYLTMADATAAGAASGAALGTRLPGARSGISTAAIIGIVAGVAAAAAVGIAVGMRGGSSSSAASIGAGTPTVGAPH